MLFTIEKAFEVKEFYERELIGLPLVTNPKVRIAGLFVSHKDLVDEVSVRLPWYMFEEDEIFTENFNDKESNYEVYIYHYSGRTVIYYSLESYLKRKEIPLYYEKGGKVF
jgi:hypothetical protein